MILKYPPNGGYFSTLEVSKPGSVWPAPLDMKLSNRARLDGNLSFDKFYLSMPSLQGSGKHPSNALFGGCSGGDCPPSLGFRRVNLQNLIGRSP